MITTTDLNILKGDLQVAFYREYYRVNELAKTGDETPDCRMLYEDMAIFFWALYQWQQWDDGSTTGLYNALTQEEFEIIVSRARGICYTYHVN